MSRKVFGEIIRTGAVEVWVSGPVSPEVLECLESFIAHKRKQHAEMNPADLVEQNKELIQGEVGREWPPHGEI